jgi:hypothetical protein
MPSHVTTSAHHPLSTRPPTPDSACRPILHCHANAKPTTSGSAASSRILHASGPTRRRSMLSPQRMPVQGTRSSGSACESHTAGLCRAASRARGTTPNPAGRAPGCELPSIVTGVPSWGCATVVGMGMVESSSQNAIAPLQLRAAAMLGLADSALSNTMRLASSPGSLHPATDAVHYEHRQVTARHTAT